MLPVKLIVALIVFAVAASAGSVPGPADPVDHRPEPAAAATARPVGMESRCSAEQPRRNSRGACPSALAITCPADVTLQCHEPRSPAYTGTATATGCGSIRIDFEDTVRPAPCPTETVLIRTWTATNGDDSPSTCVQTIRVIDTQPPVITVPSAYTNADAPASGRSGGDVAAVVDNCDPNPLFGFIDNTAPNGERNDSVTTRIWTAVDACGNVAFESRTVTPGYP